MNGATPVDWVDGDRREAFQDAVRRDTPEGALQDALPAEIRERALPIGNELILSHGDALAAISIATKHGIAVLGFDAGEVRRAGFRVVDYSGYDVAISMARDWSAYVAVVNAEAERWIQAHRLERNHGYILSSASKEEFRHIGPQRA
jgi:hypothetical protein